jgi:hypothetical protein
MLPAFAAAINLGDGVDGAQGFPDQSSWRGSMLISPRRSIV